MVCKCRANVNKLHYNTFKIKVKFRYILHVMIVNDNISVRRVNVDLK